MDYSKFDYVVTGYPRSGTAWISQFLSIHPDTICLHEPEMIGGNIVEDMRKQFLFVGCSSSVPVCVGWPINNEKTCLIDRDFDDSLRSFKEFLRKKMPSLLAGVDQTVETVRNGVTLVKPAIEIKFKQLFHMYELERLWKFAYPTIAFERIKTKLRFLLKMNIQIQHL